MSFDDISLRAYISRLEASMRLAQMYADGVGCGHLDQDKTWKYIIGLFKATHANGGKIIFIGNGGSAAIAGHMALDFSNAGKLPAICFNDGPLLTCLANDYSYERVFERAVEMYACSGDMLVAISSSGRSVNILNGVKAAKEKGCHVLTFSGFQFNNPLMLSGDTNIYVPIAQPNYGPVEMAHYVILHFILDSIAKTNNPA